MRLLQRATGCAKLTFGSFEISAATDSADAPEATASADSSAV
jgi:hypothetical protein